MLDEQRGIVIYQKGRRGKGMKNDINIIIPAKGDGKKQFWLTVIADIISGGVVALIVWLISKYLG